MTTRFNVASCRRQLVYVRSIGIGLTLFWSVAVLDFFLWTSHLTPAFGVEGIWFLLLWMVGMILLASVYSRIYKREMHLLEETDLEAGLASMAQEEKAFLESVLDSMSRPTVVIRPDYSLVLLNRGARIHHLPQGLTKGEESKCHEVLHHLDQPCRGTDHPCPLAKVIQTGKGVQVVHQHYTSDGSTIFVELETSPIFGRNGSIEGIVESERDITSQVRKQMEQQNKVAKLTRRANYDVLTGLPGRALLKDRLSQALLRARRTNKYVAVLFLDLDNFKQINDGHGHEAGDRVLVATADRIRICIRKSDSVVRYAGDEFIVVLDQLVGPSTPGAVTSKILAVLSELIHLDRDSVCVTGSIGISLYPSDSDQVDTLLRCADTAMYVAKRNGGNQARYFHRLQSVRETSIEKRPNRLTSVK